MAEYVNPNAREAIARATLHDRVLGCLFGSALGDALGLYTEFLSGDLASISYPSRKFTLLPRSEATPFRRDAHRNLHHPGEWTDDTDHALLILLAYLHSDGKELDPHEFAERLRIWVEQGLRALDTLPLGLGRTVGAIVRNKAYLDEPEGTARKHWITCNYNAAPNGSLMRTHPLGLMCLDKTPEQTFEVAASYSVMTHVDPRCIISCAIGTALVRGLVLGDITSEGHIDETIDRGLKWWTLYRERQMEDASRKGEPDLDMEEFYRHAKLEQLSDLELADGYKIGYVYKCFGAGVHLLRLAMRSGNTMQAQISIFEPLITDLIMLGGDADTNACFAGALVGSYLGFKALPPHWRDGLKYGDWLLDKSEALCAVLGLVDAVENRKDDTARDGGRGFATAKHLEEKAMLLQARMAREEQEWKKKQKEGEARKQLSWFKWKQ
jgi:ADP-ribosylglycohydrolase